MEVGVWDFAFHYPDYDIHPFRVAHCLSPIGPSRIAHRKHVKRGKASQNAPDSDTATVTYAHVISLQPLRADREPCRRVKVRPHAKFSDRPAHYNAAVRDFYLILCINGHIMNPLKNVKEVPAGAFIRPTGILAAYGPQSGLFPFPDRNSGLPRRLRCPTTGPIHL